MCRPHAFAIGCLAAAALVAAVGCKGHRSSPPEADAGPVDVAETPDVDTGSPDVAADDGPPPAPSCVCGDGLCQGAEAGCDEAWDDDPGGKRTCAADCAVCGNGSCDPGEGVTGPDPCFADCCGACGDGLCRGGECGESPATCPQDCGGAACGDGECDLGENPVDCPFDCGKYACGNGACEPGEDPYDCPEDCGAGCGNCTCDPTESYVSCPADCGYCGDGYCYGDKCPSLGVEDAGTCPFDCCVPQCGGKECGDDGCGYACGTCPEDDPCRSTCHVGYCGPAATVEALCDGLDEDCDGKTDEDLAWTDPLTGAALLKGDPCGVARCDGAVLLCATSGASLACSVDVGAELCDGKDNDCDGATDAADPAGLAIGDPRPCEVQLGVCKGTTKPADLCIAGTWIPCGPEVYAGHSAAYQPDAETLCDGKDNDCDGLTDEDLTLVQLDGQEVGGAGAACGVGMCAGGETACAPGGASLVCPTEAFAKAEACNGKDDDCDGLTDEGCGGQPGDACSDAADCEVGWCVEAAAGLVCAPPCKTTADCPSGSDCQVVQEAAALLSMCVPRFPNLCRPCTGNDDCLAASGSGGAACVDLGAAGAFCGGGCSAGKPCPAGYECADVLTVAGHPSKQCVPAASAECGCTPKYVALEAGTLCHQTNAHGSCPGWRQCGPDGLSPCDAPTPAAEVCDGADDDCDGLTDEDFKVGGVVAVDQHCGACDNDCTVMAWEHAPGGACDASLVPPACVPACEPGYHDADGAADNGCECLYQEAIDLVDPSGLDANCDGIDGVDGDGDGFASEESGGDDCRDDLKSAHPGAEEICGDDVDDDCDGATDNGC